ncbi:9093_t:CDS:1, partial [Paraglomus occultum]
MPSQWELDNKLRLVQLAQLTQGQITPYAVPVVTDIYRASSLYRQARDALRSRSRSMRENYIAAANAHAA